MEQIQTGQPSVYALGHAEDELDRIINVARFFGDLTEHVLRLASPGCAGYFVASVDQNGPVRTSHAVSCSLPISNRKSTISSISSLNFT